MNKIVRNVCDTARDRRELNKGGTPVKNASYWKRQADQLRAELAMATDAANKGDRARHEIQAVIDERDDLRVEVEEYKKITDLQHRLMKFGEERGRKKGLEEAATRCAEIAWQINDAEGAEIADAIRKEFGL